MSQEQCKICTRCKFVTLYTFFTPCKYLNNRFSLTWLCCELAFVVWNTGNKCRIELHYWASGSIGRIFEVQKNIKSTTECQINVPPLVNFRIFSNPPKNAYLDPSHVYLIFQIFFYSPVPKLTISIQIFQYQNFIN